MKINTQDYNDVTVIELQGEFTSEFVKSFEDSASSIAAEKPMGIVIDMSQVGFIDSQALECLLWLKEFCHDNLAQLKIAGLDENCRKILEITRLSSKFDAYDELSQAVKSFA